MVKTLTILLAFLISLPVFSQRIVSGVVKDRESEKPIPFPTISLDNGSLWSIGNSKGEFSVEVPDFTQTLFFSSVGYEGTKVLISELKSSDDICVYMKTDITVLDEIIISSGGVRTEILGVLNPPKDPKSLTYADVRYSAFAELYRLKKRKTRLEEMKIYIAENEIGEFTLRCRIMTKGGNGRPDKDLVKRNIVVTSDIERGWVNFNLMDREVWIEEKRIFVVVEVLFDTSKENLSNEDYDYLTPGFAYESGNGAFVSSHPGYWRPTDTKVISNLRVSYFED